MMQLKEVIFATIAMAILTLAFIIGLGFSIYTIANFTHYILDRSYCTLFIDGERIYEGRCHYIDINSVGENGNSKRVVIYKDAIHIIPIKKFVSENVVMKGMQ